MTEWLRSSPETGLAEGLAVKRLKAARRKAVRLELVTNRTAKTLGLTVAPAPLCADEVITCQIFVALRGSARGPKAGSSSGRLQGQNAGCYLFKRWR